MKALYSTAQAVPLRRVAREHRAALLPLGVVLALNILVLLVVVLPLSRSVASTEQRAETAERAQAAAEAELKEAEALREGKTRATRDLDTFYQQVLPSNVTVARRMLPLRMQVEARSLNVQYQRGITIEEEMTGSTLRRLTLQTTLSGTYDNIRAFIYDLETSPDFLVIDKMVLAEGEDANAPLSVSMAVSTYYRAPSGTRGSGADGR